MTGDRRPASSKAQTNIGPPVIGGKGVTDSGENHRNFGQMQLQIRVNSGVESGMQLQIRNSGEILEIFAMRLRISGENQARTPPNSAASKVSALAATAASGITVSEMMFHIIGCIALITIGGVAFLDSFKQS
ncbi:hypothetical protein GGX14DRAFT_406146 [Mycena pura]|uniref:Uncharacterized protein n=1 Tax=Mycena pura TaxID=153505 RepID=A0AAD6UQR1_9AGAR|nr:hypothetical protein GGX14DRAFT_406146 [Mycena pura]